MVKLILLLRKLDSWELEDITEQLSSTSQIPESSIRYNLFIKLGQRNRQEAEIYLNPLFYIITIENRFLDVLARLFKKKYIANNVIVTMGDDDVIAMSGQLIVILKLTNFIGRKLLFELNKENIYILGLDEP